MVLEAIKYTSGDLQILDQLRLPHESVYISVRTSEDAYHAIKTMTVRGAPAIAIVAALALAVELLELPEGDPSTASTEAARSFIADKLHYLVTSRPTAVNLSDAARKLEKLVAETEGGSKAVVDAYVKAAERMLIDDVSDNKNIGENGVAWARQSFGSDKFSILTICNTGSLATAGYGTALGIIRSVHANNLLEHAYALETRPYNQGSRLTAYELVHDNIPATLITDSMASILLKTHPEIKMVVVGADRVARNGDTANKIGTYQLAITAKFHGVKVVVAAPTTSIDLLTASGDDIVIEQRKPEEMVTMRGPVVDADGSVNKNEVKTVHIAAPGIGVWNPAFDFAPASLIDAIVTEKGVAEKDADGKFHLDKFF
ncbi:hypothetical protein BZA70DRAFT_277933 [Myxozyma melibiosi]|uniref:Methylthioribose-1-phosphate isomerase n=1 Tax=Myxozyma melibiosi TaxID=54550 RepID=A0ABR1F8F7_9ASCO